MSRRSLPERALPESHVERFGPGPVPQGARLLSREVEEWLERARASDPSLRRRAVQALCPCHVQGDEAGVWDRILEMVQDADASVRRSVFHALTDGSPRAREADVMAAIEQMRQDDDLRLRRSVRQFMAQYRRTGRVNVN